MYVSCYLRIENSKFLSAVGQTMDWESEFQRKKTFSEENEACATNMEGIQRSGLIVNRKPLQDVNNERHRIATWSSTNSFKNLDKKTDIVDDSQDSGISFSPAKGVRYKRTTKRFSKLLSPTRCTKRESFESIDEDEAMEVGELYDDEDFELSPMPDAPANISQNMISSLLSGQIKNIPVESEKDIADSNKENFLVRKAIPRRIFNYNNDGTPPSSKALDIFKRPSVPGDFCSPAGHKRIKSASHGELVTPSGSDRNSLTNEEESSGDESVDMLDLDKSWEAPNQRCNKIFARSHSESAVSIMKAVEKIDSDSMLIGDGTKRYVLPVISKGKHSDLKEISGDTLIKLMNGKFSHLVDHFDIIDCRYPYEFEGGHIRGAINIHTQKQLHERFLQNKRIAAGTMEGSLKERHIILFHCEFSSQRAPDLCRFLREADRKCNLNSFPFLHYPELYVLHGGYKDFFEHHLEFCEPQTYLEMSDPKHAEKCRWHKNKSKTDVVSIKSFGIVAPKTQRKPALKKFIL